MISRLTSIVWKPAKLPPTPTPESLVIEPDESARVTRLKNGRYHIQWQHPAENITIYASSEPCLNGETRLWATITGAQSVVVPPMPDTLRPYFILEFEEGDCQLVGERYLPMPNSFNFRDIGGYLTEDGNRIRWGQVYRSGSLAHLDQNDFDFLDSLDIQLVFDLRSSYESENDPDRLPANQTIQHLSRPLSSSGTTLERVRVLRQYRNEIGGLLLRLYQEAFIDENAHHIGDMLTRMADPANRPALIHCSAGKDRTGVTIALLLSILGVPEDTIMADYSLSNFAHENIAQIMSPELRQARWVGVGKAKMAPLLLANPAHLQATFDYIRQKYGSIESYLCGAAGMTPQTLNQLRQELVV